MTRPRLALACAPLALALILAACGGSGSTTAPGGGADGSTATQAPAMTDAGGAAATDAAGGGADATADAGGGAATTLPACADLLPDAEAAKVIGQTPKPVVDGSSPYSVYCTWDIGDGFGLTIDATVDPSSVDLWRGKKDSVPTANGGKETTPPSGLGDEAYAFDADAGTYWIFVRRGDRALSVHFPAVPSEQTVRDLVDTLFSRL